MFPRKKRNSPAGFSLIEIAASLFVLGTAVSYYSNASIHQANMLQKIESNQFRTAAREYIRANLDCPTTLANAGTSCSSGRQIALYRKDGQLLIAGDGSTSIGARYSLQASCSGNQISVTSTPLIAINTIQPGASDLFQGIPIQCTAGSSGSSTGSTAGSTTGSSTGSTTGSSTGTTTGSSTGSMTGSSTGSTSGSTTGSSTGTTTGSSTGSTTGCTMVNTTNLTFSPSALTKVTVSDAIIKTSSNSADINYWLNGLGPTWNTTTWVMNNQIYFSIPCKINDSFWGGWHRIFASWSPGQTAATYSNGSTVSPGPTPDWSKFEAANDGYAENNDQKNFNFVVGPGSLIYGIGVMRQPGYSSPEAQFPVPGVTQAQLLHLSAVDTSHPNIFTTVYTPIHELYYEPTTLTMYDFWTDYASQSTLTVTQTPDMLTRSAPDIVLSNNLAYASVVQAGTQYLMVAYNTASLHWELYSSPSLTSWDFSNPIDLNLRSFVGTGGAWDQANFCQIGSACEPRLAGVRILGSQVYIFYRAGNFVGNTGGNEYPTPNGIGVLTAPLYPVQACQ